jgi:TolB-like protein
MKRQNQIMQAIEYCLTNGKFALLLFVCFLSSYSFGQDFDKKITDIATEIADKVTATGKRNIAIIEFDNSGGSQTQLGVFLADEISSSLAILSSNQSKFTVLERANLDLILEEKRILKSFDRSKLAKDLGKINAAEILISATITEFNGYYRLNIKLLDTKTGNSLNSAKVSFVQEPSLKELNKQTIEKSDFDMPKKSYQEENNYQPKPTEQKPVYSQSVTTEVCFNNISSSYSAIVNIKNPNTGEKVKNVDVLGGQKACVYNIQSGVYQIEVSWFYYQDSKSRIQRTDTREINVKSASDNLFELKFY